MNTIIECSDLSIRDKICWGLNNVKRRFDQLIAFYDIAPQEDLDKEWNEIILELEKIQELTELL